MQIQHSHSGHHGKFFILEQGEETALMTYHDVDDKTILIEHTEVSDIYKGQGVGAQLVQAAVDLAREKGLKIIPVCSFARRVFEKTPAYSDVLAV